MKGHFKDEDLLHFHRRCLGAHGLGTEGYATTERIVVPERLRQEAQHLVASRRARGTLWGWKEPRTTLFLDFWESILPEAKFVFVFRRPWEVVDSFFRRGDPLFRAKPSHAVAVWTNYNRLLLDFYHRHPEKTFICEVTQAIESPATVFANIRQKFGIALGPPPRTMANSRGCAINCSRNGSTRSRSHRSATTQRRPSGVCVNSSRRRILKSADCEPTTSGPWGGD
ncbi:MAG: hypothetical protein WCJ18_00625 [Planctomycetota bacterium]